MLGATIYELLYQKKDWDIIRKKCYKKANYKCDICGCESKDLDAHEVWDFNIDTKTQYLLNIIALCNKCHGVKHMRNSERIGFGESAKKHFLEINKCDEITLAKHLFKLQLLYEERNKVLRWKIKANLDEFGEKGMVIKEKNIPLIKNPYKDIDFVNMPFEKIKNNLH